VEAQEDSESRPIADWILSGDWMLAESCLDSFRCQTAVWLQVVFM